ncbi:MAG: hypothetical protein HGA45_37530 [Chloroflexales bacterium]|nr:hypothetical protein [Chloroflexales bacterium]
MRLWFCSPGCAEAFAEGPRPWPAPIVPDVCPVCDAPRPTTDVYLVTPADLSAGYFQWTIQPFVQLGGYLIVRCDSDWRVAAWEHLFSGLKLATREFFENPVDAYRVAEQLTARDQERGQAYKRAWWPLVVVRARRWQVELVRSACYTCSDDDEPSPNRPEEGAAFTLRRILSPKTGHTSVSATGTVRHFADLWGAVESRFPRFRLALAKAWTDLGLAP